MTEADGRYHLLHYLEQILLRPLANFPCRQGGGGMGDKDGTQAVPHFCTTDQRLEPIGEIDDFFQTSRLDLEMFRHSIHPLTSA